MNTNDDLKILKDISPFYPQKITKVDKMQGKTITSLKKIKKEIPFKSLNFNPLSFISHKYSPKTLMIMNTKKSNFLEKSRNRNNINTLNKNLKDNREYIYSMNTSRIKLKPLNKNNSCSQLYTKNENILIPSYKATQDIINYNLSNTHNTLFNYYHKNNSNVKKIKIVKYLNNLKEPNHFSNSVDKSFTSNKTLCKNSYIISQNEKSTYVNNNSLNNNEILNNNPLTNKYIKIDNKRISYPSRHIINKLINNHNLNSNINKLDYAAEIFGKKLPHNIRFFHNHFFREQNKEENKKANSLLFHSPNSNKKEDDKALLTNRSNDDDIKYQVIEFGGKNRLMATKLTNQNIKEPFSSQNNEENDEDFHHIMKNPFPFYENNCEDSNGKEVSNNTKNNPLEYGDLANKIQQLILNPNTSKIRNNRIIVNTKLIPEKKELSYKEIRDISKKGYEKMMADKYRNFNNLIKNTNKEVIELGEKLDELLENNKKKFLKAEDGLF